MTSITDIIEEPKDGGRTSPLRVITVIAIVLIGFILHTVDGKLDAAVLTAKSNAEKLDSHNTAQSNYNAQSIQQQAAIWRVLTRICIQQARSDRDRTACIEN